MGGHHLLGGRDPRQPDPGEVPEALTDPLRSALHRRPVLLLDGGFATECERRGADLRDALWSARLLADDPALVIEVHRAFVESGAEVISTASYQASVEGFATRGLNEARTRELIGLSVALARDAGAPIVAGSVGPWGAAQADGSEYTGYRVPRDVLERFHAPRLEALTEAGADCLAIETMPGVEEVEVILGLLDNTPVWVSFSCRDDGQLADGTPIEDAVRRVADRPGVVAVGVNCVPPDRVIGLLRRASTVTAKPLVAYPNSGEYWNAGTRSWQATASAGEWDVAGWVDAGARLVGGCCRTGPEQIAALADRLKGLE